MSHTSGDSSNKPCKVTCTAMQINNEKENKPKLEIVSANEMEQPTEGMTIKAGDSVIHRDGKVVDVTTGRVIGVMSKAGTDQLFEKYKSNKNRYDEEIDK